MSQKLTTVGTLQGHITAVIAIGINSGICAAIESGSIPAAVNR